MKKVICFSRVSSQHQDLTYQLDAVKREILHDGYKESEILVVKGKESAIKLKEEERQTLTEMKKLVEENPSIEACYFFAVDRLARRMSVIMSVKEWADERNINLCFLNPQPMKTFVKNEKGELVKNDVTSLYLLLLSYGAAMEMKIKQERFNESKALRRKQNKVTGSLSFGYTSDKDGTIIVDKKEAAILNWVFDCYLEKRMSLNQIYNEGVELGYWSKIAGRSGGASKVRHLLIDKKYCGKPNERSKYGMTYPVIIDEEKIDAAIELLSKKKVGGAKTFQKNIYYAKSILRDEKSNTVMIADRNHIKYTASNAKNKYGVNMNVADSLIWLSAFQAKWVLVSKKDDSTKEITRNSIDEVVTKIENLTNTINNEIQPQIDRNYNAYIKSRISEDIYEDRDDELKKQYESTRKKIQELEKREIELGNILCELERKEQVDVEIESFRDIEDNRQRKEIIDEVITNMTVNKIRDNWYVFKVYNVLGETDTYLYVAHSGKKTELYEVLGNTNDVIDDFIGTTKEGVDNQILVDILSELQIRFVREQR